MTDMLLTRIYIYIIYFLIISAKHEIYRFLTECCNIFLEQQRCLFSQNYFLTEFEESNHDDEPLGRTGNIFCYHVKKNYEK